jgi:hypothetical protein
MDAILKVWGLGGKRKKLSLGFKNDTFARGGH